MADYLYALAALVDMELPEECAPGVRVNLQLLAEHWRNLEGFAEPDAQ